MDIAIVIPAPAVNIPIVQVITACNVFAIEYPVSGDHTQIMGFSNV